MQSTLISKARILIVDDEQAIRELLKSILCDRYECTTAGSAEEALTYLDNNSFDLVISDINMGGMSGIELIPRVEASSPDTTVMMISGNQDIDSPIEAIRRGAFDYIKKPFEIDQVVMAVDRAIGHSALMASKRCHEHHLEELIEERTGKLHYLAYHDPLTGLANRPFFEERLDELLWGTSTGSHAAVLYVSLDKFETLRDTLGHSFGDQILQKSGKRLSLALETGSLAARFDSNEFAVLTSARNSEDLTRIADVIMAAFVSPIIVSEHEIAISVSIGISMAAAERPDAQALLKNAGAALSHAKKRGGNNYHFYTTGMHEAALRNLRLENDLRHALERGEFELHYQPKIDMHTSKILGMEALIRWNHPELGLVPPLEFIPLAEETGLIVLIGEWTVSSACSQTKEWHEMGHLLNVAVNLSTRQFRQKGLAEKILSVVRNTGFDPRYLNLEVTESSIMNNPEAAIDILRELRETGIHISIDDFGTGYSSLGYLKNLPIDVLKIDKTFVDDVTNDPDDAALVMAVITLAHSLQLTVIAEGVETEEQLRFLRLLRCDQWQGYLCSKPLAAAAFEKMLTEHSLSFCAGKSSGSPG